MRLGLILLLIAASGCSNTHPPHIQRLSGKDYAVWLDRSTRLAEVRRWIDSQDRPAHVMAGFPGADCWVVELE